MFATSPRGQFTSIAISIRLDFLKVFSELKIVTKLFWFTIYLKLFPAMYQSKQIPQTNIKYKYHFNVALQY